MTDPHDLPEHRLPRLLDAIDAAPHASDAFGASSDLEDADDRRLVQLIREALPATPPATFREGFAARVAQRVTASRPLRFGLERQFRRLMPLAAAAILALGLANVLSGRARGASFWEAMLGLTPMTFESTLFDADLSSASTVAPEAMP